MLKLIKRIKVIKIGNQVTKNKLKLTTPEIIYITKSFSSILYSENEASITFRNNISAEILENINEYVKNPTLQLKEKRLNNLVDTLYYGLGIDRFVKMKIYPQELPHSIMGKDYINIYEKIITVKNINFNEIDEFKATENILTEFDNISGRIN